MYYFSYANYSLALATSDALVFASNFLNNETTFPNAEVETVVAWVAVI